MASSEVEITNLLYRYAELIDGGDLPGAAALFAHASIRVGGSEAPLDSEGLLALWRRVVRLHGDGTPRTRHVITNPIVEVDEARDRATCRSCYTVLQATDQVPLQVVAAGRYHDEFERVDGRWRFRYRDYTMLDMTGNLSDHLLVAVRR